MRDLVVALMGAFVMSLIWAGLLAYGPTKRTCFLYGEARAEGYAAAVDSVRAVGDSLSHIEPRTAPLKWYADTCIVWRTRGPQ